MKSIVDNFFEKILKSSLLYGIIFNAKNAYCQSEPLLSLVRWQP